ncbi:MFS transporter [Corynebacterium ammoniagenes DSM 20306]|uniref:Transporter, major facilitator family protein n=2 Tax=Corynebacterium ammoniagenes TaxID=1697 RepID=A0ABP2IK30_CORAM|nr:MFS transporter [Corynebacterium ammoniagenes DSM 20306]AQS74911.1 MFS transporter [Corynebacterium ammoniagenes]EFG81649.1 transporter, major facilitator family protein [Corynebacterium ammoniagenes DSM 20306]
MTAEHKRVLAGSMVGTTIEWFDFFIYAQAAGLIFAAQFFDPVSNANPSLAQIISWASLGISFLFRPLGAVLAGHLGDRMGRKPVLVITLLGMGAATMLMGLLPTYHAIGIAAPILLVLLRILQGMSAGGEWGGAALLTVEHAPHGRRGFFGAFPQIGVPTGMALATIFMLILSSILTTEEFLAWGWRIPFLSSVVLIIVGYFIRRTVEESPAFEEMQELKKDSSAPLAVLFKNHWATVLKCALIFAANNAIGYFVIAYFISYGTKYIGYERTDALAVALAGAAAWLVSTLYFGKLSDRVGRKRTFLIGYIFLAIWSVPMWLLVDTGNVAMFYLAVIVVGFLLGPTYGPMCALFAEMFPVKVRLSGVSIGYAIGSIIGGAFAPMLAEILYTTYNTSMAIAAYCVVITIISLIGVLLVPKGIQDKDLHV